MASVVYVPNERELESWNSRFREGTHTPAEPDGFFVSAYQDYIQPLLSDPPERHVLDVACGAGRHGLWLAERGWHATLVDASSEGLAIARRRSRGRNLQVELLERDLEQVSSPRQLAPDGPFDAVLVFFYLQRDLFPALIGSLAPGGLLVFKTYTEEQRRFGGGPTHPAHLLKSGELLEAVAGLRVLHYRETVRERGVAEVVAQKAASIL